MLPSVVIFATMHDLNDLYYFVQVVDHRGFAPAGRALGLQKSKLSRRIALLEARLGVRLLRRSTRQFSVTEVGQEFYRQCVAIMAEIEVAQAIIDNVKAEPKGIVRMACPPGLLAYRFSDAVAHYMLTYPKVELQLKAFNRRVDVIGEGFDVVIRMGLPVDEQSMLITRKLGEISHCLVASPLLLRDRAVPTAPIELSGLPSLDFGLAHAEHPQREHRWCVEHESRLVATIAHRPRLVTDDIMSLHATTLAGAGIAQLPYLMVEDDLAGGRLVEVLPNWRPRNEAVHAVFPSRRGVLLSVNALLDTLTLDCRPYRHGTRCDINGSRPEALAHAPQEASADA